MPQLPNESEAEFLDRLCAMSEDAAEEDLDEVDVEVRSKERKRRKDEKKEAERKAKEAKEEAERKAKEEEAARKAKEEKRKRREEKAAKAAAAKPVSQASVASGSGGKGSQASGSGGKAKKAKSTRKASDIDEGEEDEDEAPAEKKAKREPCQRCARLQVPCADPDPSHGGRGKACEGCRNAKVRCVRETTEADGNRVYEAIQELSELVEGIAEDHYISQREIKGSLQDIIQFEAARLRLDFGDEGKAEANRLLALRKTRRDGWKAADEARAKGEGSSKEK
ncbi:hypothetical protein DFH08DRAFT_974575 [Mycena albidolilacea]|uniref:Zn(2)-C6 fungal-type domain-containing protein n=1 Tax=Mycena albidolilacea TaxID=1033008 RepID=A0AAD6Z6Z6_9AGAR|nr:hypothetical protein DFH08DRAFT_974575 [Mycena albidolilacea]